MAEAAIPLGPIPSRRAFMANVTDRFRSLWRRAIQVAKKAGNWILNLTPVKWAVRGAKSLGTKIWGFAKPAALWGQRYVVKPAATGLGVTLAFLFGSKLIALLSGLGILGLIAVVIWVNRRGKVKAITAETDNVTPLPTPEEPKKKPRRRVVTETITEVIEDDDTEEVKEVTVEQTETTETTEVKTEVAQTEAAGSSNGYKVRLPEGDLIPNETLTQRFHVLDALINAEMNKAEIDQEYLCELQARQNLIHVRAGKHSGVKKDATVGEIHRDFRATLEKAWEREHPDQDIKKVSPAVSGIYPMALHRGAQAENTRVSRIQALKAEHDRLKKGKAA